ncbi:thiopeptide-type bacteriocin biosynthesis protein [Nocardia amamiensis]|uniref:thiopeptide-type bacteriocin biosynthesis protein n=1 Tax=Nocardia amamiensis TaxID=404578 RepID=UPI0033D6316C
MMPLDTESTLKSIATPSVPTRKLAAAVIESFAAPDLERVAAQAGVPVDVLVAARDAFISAGTAAIHGLDRQQRWLQFSISLGPDGWQRIVRSDIGTRIRVWLRDGPGRGFFFMHKEPGLRVRFCGVDDGCAGALREALDVFVAETTITAWTSGPYDAEVMQFGGATGLSLTHQWFTAESLAVLEHHRLRLDGTARIGSELFSLMLIDRLLRRLCDDWERWDVWCKLALTGRLVGDAAGAVDLSRSRATRLLLSHQARILGAAGEPERKMFARYDTALDELCPEIQAAVDAGRLLWGLREILPFWMVFHWNRMAFDFETQKLLAATGAAALSPKGTPEAVD